MPLHFYDKKARTAQRIRDWLQDQELKKGVTWRAFRISILQEYGFSEKAVIKILEEVAPGLTIVKGDLVKNE